MHRQLCRIFILLIMSLIFSSCSINRYQPNPNVSELPSETPHNTMLGNTAKPTEPAINTDEPTPPADIPEESAEPAGNITEPINSPGSIDIQDPIENSLSPSDIPEEILSKMTLEEKIGQMFFIASRFNSSKQRRLYMDDQLEQDLIKFKPGGFVLFSENLDTIPQTKSFINSIQKYASIPMFIGIDEEGGVISRLNMAEKLHSTVMPSPYEIGITGNPEYAYKSSQAIAKEISSLGFNLNFAPVADIFSNPDNMIISWRAYSSDGPIASQMVAQAVKGMRDSGIISVLKHFPGHGDTLEDTHTGAAIIKNNLERLRAVELLPFKSGIEAGAKFVMTAHVKTPEITGNDLPATLSKPIIQGLLREELGFDGVIITDSFEMNAISSYYPEEEAVVMAVEAGVDILLMPNDLNKAFNSILSAVKGGRISEERIEESVTRILKVKIEDMTLVQSFDAERTLGSPGHLELAEQIRKGSAP